MYRRYRNLGQQRDTLRSRHNTNASHALIAVMQSDGYSLSAASGLMGFPSRSYLGSGMVSWVPG